MKNKTDINHQGLIARLPPLLRPYALLMRLDRPAGTWLLLLPGLWSITLASGGADDMNVHDLWIFVLFGLGALIMRGAGCVINDLWDRRLDAQVARTAQRPLASGALAPQQAFILLAILLGAGLAILLQLSIVAVLLGFLTIPLIVIYPLMKRITWWPQLFLGITFNFGALMGWAAITGVLSLPALLLYAGGIFWTLGYDTIYAQQDIEDDLVVGIRSTAIKFGAQAKQWVSGFYIAAWLLIVAAFLAAGAGILSVFALVLGAAHLARQVEKWDVNDPQICLKIFKSNRDFGFLILLAALV